MEQSQINFCVVCPLQDVKKINVVGSIAELGLWQPEKGLELIQENEKWINKQALALNLCSQIEFKLCLWQQGNEQVQWEPLPNNCNHKIQIIDKTMVLEWEYSKANIVNTFQSKGGSSENQTEVKELKMKYEKLMKDSQAKELSQQKEISELQNALQNEKKNFQDAHKVHADFEDKIKQLESKLQQKDKESSQLQTSQQEITKLQKINEEQKLQLEKANANTANESKENQNNKILIEKLTKELTEMKTASSTQAPQAKEQETKEQISPSQESSEIPAQSNKSKKNKNKKQAQE